VQLLTPWTALGAALAAVPLLVLLYLLKLRRRPLRLPSTLLWRKSFEDLQVNAPFQKLRWSILLLLQLALLTLLLAALARPVIQAGDHRPSRLIVLVDRSASMSALDAPGDADDPPRSRLEAAKAEAIKLIERLGRGERARQVMIVAFAASAEVISSFESHRTVLIDAINSIQPTDEQADFAAALKLTDAFAARGESADDAPPEIVLISDGSVGMPDDHGGFRLRAGTFRFVRVPSTQSASINNLGVTSLGVRRDWDDPVRLQVFARVSNAGPEPVTAPLTLRIDDSVASARMLDIPASTDQGPGESSTTFAIELPGDAVLSLELGHRDSLDADDAAAIVVPPPDRPSIVIVHPGEGPDPWLRDLLDAQEPRLLRDMSVAAYESLNQTEVDAGSVADVIVFDRVSARLPGVPSITVGAAPLGVETRPVSADAGRRVLSWHRQHPVMGHVSLDTVIYSGFGGYELPAGAESLAIGPDGAIIAAINQRGTRHLLIGFELGRSNWPTNVSNTVFLQNALDYLTLSRSGDAGVVFQPGRPITVRTRPGASRIIIRGPQAVEIDARGGDVTVLPLLRRAGVYEVEGATLPGMAPAADADSNASNPMQLALSVLSEQETDIRPRYSLLVNAEEAAAGGLDAVAPRELWPLLIAAAAVLLIAEWAVYLFKASRGT
jgi:hypothetical protein